MKNNKTDKKRNDDMGFKFSGKSGSIIFNYIDFKLFEKDLRTRLMPSLDDPSQKKLDTWIKRKEVETQLENNILPN